MEFMSSELLPLQLPQPVPKPLADPLEDVRRTIPRLLSTIRGPLDTAEPMHTSLMEKSIRVFTCIAGQWIKLLCKGDSALRRECKSMIISLMRHYRLYIGGLSAFSRDLERVWKSHTLTLEDRLCTFRVTLQCALHMHGCVVKVPAAYLPRFSAVTKYNLDWGFGTVAKTLTYDELDLGGTIINKANGIIFFSLSHSVWMIDG